MPSDKYKLKWDILLSVKENISPNSGDGQTNDNYQMVNIKEKVSWRYYGAWRKSLCVRLGAISENNFIIASFNIKSFI